MEPLTEYEAEVVARIAEWKGRRRGGLSRVYDAITKPFVQLTMRCIPTDMAKKLVERVYRTAEWRAERDSVLRACGVRRITELRDGPLERCDEIVRKTEAINHGYVSAESVIAGEGGLATELLDIPIEVMNALRSIRRIAACYGYPLDRTHSQTLVLLILGLSVIEDADERREAERRIWMIVDGINPDEGHADAIREIEDEMIEEIGATVLENKLEESIPIVGALVGVILDNVFIHNVEITAKRIFQERWLRDKGKVESVAPVESSAFSRESIRHRVRFTCYVTGYTVGFSLAFPAILAAKVGRATLPDPILDAIKDGAAAASRDVERFTSGRAVALSLYTGE
jgi:hypothetical protein